MTFWCRDDRIAVWAAKQAERLQAMEPMTALHGAARLHRESRLEYIAAGSKEEYDKVRGLDELHPKHCTWERRIWYAENRMEACAHLMSEAAFAIDSPTPTRCLEFEMCVERRSGTVRSALASTLDIVLMTSGERVTEGIYRVMLERLGPVPVETIS